MNQLVEQRQSRLGEGPEKNSKLVCINVSKLVMHCGNFRENFLACSSEEAFIVKLSWQWKEFNALNAFGEQNLKIVCEVLHTKSFCSKNIIEIKVFFFVCFNKGSFMKFWQPFINYLSSRRLFGFARTLLRQKSFTFIHVFNFSLIYTHDSVIKF